MDKFTLLGASITDWIQAAAAAFAAYGVVSNLRQIRKDNQEKDKALRLRFRPLFQVTNYVFNDTHAFHLITIKNIGKKATFIATDPPEGVEIYFRYEDSRHYFSTPFLLDEDQQLVIECLRIKNPYQVSLTFEDQLNNFYLLPILIGEKYQLKEVVEL